jgi:hypothetical protein
LLFAYAGTEELLQAGTEQGEFAMAKMTAEDQPKSLEEIYRARRKERERFQ